MRKALTTLAVFLIFLGCGFKPIYKMTSDDTSIAVTLSRLLTKLQEKLLKKLIALWFKVKIKNIKRFLVYMKI